jgi:Cdc6-like AAA superfamily ATPase
VIYIKIPANVYNFKSFIYGVSLEKFIIIIAGISIIATISTISLLGAIITGIIYFAIMTLLRFEPENLYAVRKIYFHYSSTGLKFVKNNELYGISGKYIFSVIEIGNRELYTDTAKNVQMTAIEHMLDTVTCGTTIVVRPELIKESIYYRTFVILKVNTTNFNAGVDIIRENIPAVRAASAVKITLLDDEDAFRNIFRDSVKIYSNYFVRNGLYGAYFDVVDMDYSADFLYQSIIEKLGFMVELNIDLKSLNGRDILLKRLLATRKAELSYTKTGHYASILKKQINSLEAMSKQEKIYNVFMRFSVLTDHPAELRKNSETFLRVMKSAGFKMKPFNFFNDDSFNPLLSASQGKKYMMDSGAISTIFPCGFTALPEYTGEPLGMNTITGKTVYMNLFRGSSYNIAVTGETGSGKSYFTGILLDRMESSSSVYIIDPLMEYSGDQIIELGTGQYPDFTIDSSELKNIIPELLGSISGINISAIRKIIDIKPDGMTFSNLISSITEYEKVNSITLNSELHKLFSSPVKIHGNRCVFRFDYGNSRYRDLFFRLALTFTASIAEKRPGNKIIVIDESHLFLKDLQSAEMIDMLARNGRHYRISLITITQNVDDYYFNNYSESILRNSRNYFIFRQREKIKNKLFLGYGIDPASLAGGSNFSYSECFYATGTLIQKLKITANNEINE